MEEVVARVEEVMKDLGLSFQQIHIDLEMSYRKVNYSIKSKSLDMDFVHRFCHFYKVSANYLIFDLEPKYLVEENNTDNILHEEDITSSYRAKKGNSVLDDIDNVIKELNLIKSKINN